MSRSEPIYGALHDVDRAVRTHLFGIAPNNSGSTFLKEALATCRATWNLSREGQRLFGFAGPATHDEGALIWSTESRWLSRLTDPGAYDWERNRRAWYFQAFARDPEASVFYTKAPPFLLYVGELVRHFPHTKFLFMVRNPYAVCEGICRNLRCHSLARGRDLPTAAARHVVTCFDYQRRNVAAYGKRGVFFTYEAMCEDPEAVEEKIRALVPELDDLRLRQRLLVKGNYNEVLTNMNGRQIARLDAAQIAAFNRVFKGHRDVLDHFGYELMEPGR
ncbi:MAG: sulfotransferase [Acidobacteria bacterium]|nr:sulfotransferase [Acidobacteriota bacterium]